MLNNQDQVTGKVSVDISSLLARDWELLHPTLEEMHDLIGRNIFAIVLFKITNDILN